MFIVAPNTKSNFVIKIPQARMSPTMLRRLKALAAAPGWYVGAVTLQYFLMRHIVIGNIFYKRWS